MAVVAEWGGGHETSRKAERKGANMDPQEVLQIVVLTILGVSLLVLLCGIIGALAGKEAAQEELGRDRREQALRTAQIRPAPQLRDFTEGMRRLQSDIRRLGLPGDKEEGPEPDE